MEDKSNGIGARTSKQWTNAKKGIIFVNKSTDNINSQKGKNEKVHNPTPRQPDESLCIVIKIEKDVTKVIQSYENNSITQTFFPQKY